MNRIDGAKGAGRWGATRSTAGSEADTRGSSGEGGGSGSSGASSVGRGMQVSLQTSRTAHDYQPIRPAHADDAAEPRRVRFRGVERVGPPPRGHFLGRALGALLLRHDPTVTWLRDDGRTPANDVNDA